MRSVPVVLSIAGFDPSSGAGITADLKTIAAHDCYGLACISALTVQSTQGVESVEPLSPHLVTRTLNRLAEDFEFAAIKIGMLGTSEVAEAVAGFLELMKPRRSVPIVLDPILRSSSGIPLLQGEGWAASMSLLFPLVTVITPNVSESEALAMMPVQGREEMEVAARRVQRLGARNVVIKGGHLPGDSALDFLMTEAGVGREFAASRLAAGAVHGAGCAFSASLACYLADGNPLETAVGRAKSYVGEAIRKASSPGKGARVLNHLLGACVSRSSSRNGSKEG